MSEKKFHFFAMTFMWSVPSGASYNQTYMGWPDKTITVSRIGEAKNSAGAPDAAVMLSCAYLGYMTTAEFKGDHGA